MIPRTPSSTTYHDTIRMIEDGDKRNSTNLSASPEDLGDNVEFLRTRFGGAASASGVWYPIPISLAFAAHAANAVDVFERTYAPGNSDYPLQAVRTYSGTTAASAHTFVLPLSGLLPPAGLLRSFKIDILATSTAYSLVPLNMPSARLYDYNVSDLTLTPFVGPGLDIECKDTSPTREVYNVRHTMGITYLSGGPFALIDLSVYRNLFLRIDTEYGQYADNNTYYYNPRCLVVKDKWTGVAP